MIPESFVWSLLADAVATWVDWYGETRPSLADEYEVTVRFVHVASHDEWWLEASVELVATRIVRDPRAIAAAA